jgi:hypothetical protein
MRQPVKVAQERCRSANSKCGSRSCEQRHLSRCGFSRWRQHRVALGHDTPAHKSDDFRSLIGVKLHYTLEDHIWILWLARRDYEIYTSSETTAGTQWPVAYQEQCKETEQRRSKPCNCPLHPYTAQRVSVGLTLAIIVIVDASYFFGISAFEDVARSHTRATSESVVLRMVSAEQLTTFAELFDL